LAFVGDAASDLDASSYTAEGVLSASGAVSRQLAAARSESGSLGSSGAVSIAEAVELDHVEKFSKTLANGDSSDTFTLVTELSDISKAFLFFGVRDSQNTPSDCQVRGKITATDTVTFNRDGTSGDVR